MASQLTVLINIYISNKDLSVAEKLLQEDATIIYNWFCTSRLSIHTGKTNNVTSNNVDSIVPVNICVCPHTHIWVCYLIMLTAGGGGTFCADFILLRVTS